MNSKNYPWIVIGLLWSVAFLNAADRSILTAVMPLLRGEFGLTDNNLSLLNSVFFWVYGISAFLFGRIGDSVRRTRMIIFGLLFWSVATGIVPLATGFAMLLGMRAMVAVGESTYYPTATAFISEWHKPENRGRALSLHQTGVFAGSGLGAYFAGLLADRYGWTSPFIVFAIAGGLLCIILYFLLRDAPKIEAPKETAQAEPLGVVLRNPAVLALCAVFFCGTGASSAVLVWAGTFAHDKFGLNLANSALVGSTTINIAGFFSVLVGGWLADKMAARSPIGRFYILAIGLFLAAIFLMPIAVATSAAMVGVILVLSSFGKGLFDGCIYASMHAPPPLA
jgi:sugar phosphate permease